MTDDVRIRELFAARIRGATTAAFLTLGGGAFVGGSAFAAGDAAGVVMGIVLAGAGCLAIRDVERIATEGRDAV